LPAQDGNWSDTLFAEYDLRKGRVVFKEFHRAFERQLFTDEYREGFLREYDRLAEVVARLVAEMHRVMDVALLLPRDIADVVVAYVTPHALSLPLRRQASLPAGLGLLAPPSAVSAAGAASGKTDAASGSAADGAATPAVGSQSAESVSASAGAAGSSSSS
jgi:hypothetical protein